MYHGKNIESGPSVDEHLWCESANDYKNSNNDD
jgi:hypothetical protein